MLSMCQFKLPVHQATWKSLFSRIHPHRILFNLGNVKRLYIFSLLISVHFRWFCNYFLTKRYYKLPCDVGAKYLIINIFHVYFESYNHCCGSHQNASLRSSTGGSLMDWKPQSCCTLISVPSLPQRLCFSHVAPSQRLIWRGILWLLDFGLRIPWPSCQTLLGYIIV